MRKARVFWWVGTALLAAAVGLLFLEQPAALCVSLLVAGLIVSFVAQTLELCETGWTADAVDHYAQTVALGAFATAFFFHHILWVLVACLVCGLLAVFISFGAQSVGHWGETKELLQRWKARKTRR